MTTSKSPRRKPSLDAAHPDEGTGTRSVERALRLLKELSSRGEFGWRLSDLADRVGLDRATCHRLLACFVKEGYAQRLADDLKYYPGQTLFEMGLALPRFAALREVVDPRLHHLSLTTHCIASFTLRSGNDMVCVFQQRAGLELSGMLVKVGTRRPLVTAVGGLAILQHLPQDEAARVIAENHRRERARGGERRIEKLELMRLRSQAYGFGFTLGDIAPGLAAVAVAIHNSDDAPVAAVTLTGTDKAMNERTVGEFHAKVKALAQELEGQTRWCVR